MHRRRLLLAGLPVALAMAVHAAAAAPELAASDAAPGTAAAFIQALGRELPQVVGDATTEPEKRRRLTPFITRIVDLDSVSRFCLGRFWRVATAEQQAAFRALFLRVIVNAVAMRVGAYASGAARVSVLPEQPRPDGVSVPTVVQTGDEPPVHVTWLVDTDARPMRILDVQAEGMSMRLAQRSDYVSFLDHHGGDIALFLRSLAEHTP